MTSRAQQIALYINAHAKSYPWAFIGVVGVLIVAAFIMWGVAIRVLMLGPIGVELLEAYGESGLNRLSALQLSVFSALVFTGLVGVLTHCRWGLISIQGLLEQSPFRSSKLYWGLIALLMLLVNVAMLWGLPIIACLEPDTVGYLKPSALRSAGYMVFIDVVVAVTGDLRWVMPIQLNLMLVSFVALGWAVRQHVDSLITGFVVSVVPMLSSSLLILSPAVMSDALFVALICFHISAALWALRSPRWVPLLWVGLSLGLMIVVRPNGISFLVGIGLLVYLLRPHWKRVLVATIVPVVFIAGGQGLYNAATFGFFGLHKFGGISLVGNYAPLIRADMGGEYPEFNAELADKLTKYSVDFPAFEQRGYPYEMAEVAANTAVGAIYKIILPSIRERFGLPEPEAAAFEYDPRINQLAGEIALTAVFNDPWGALKIVTSNFITSWHLTLPVRVPMSIYYPRCLDMSQKLTAQYPDLIHTKMNMDIYQSADLAQKMKMVADEGIRLIEYPRLLISVIQSPLAYIAMLLALWGLVKIVILGAKSSSEMIVLGFAALSLHAGYGLISLGNTAFTRYTVVFDPVVILMLSVAVLSGVRYVFEPECDQNTSV
ncbi:MAG: glycosyltransferase family 39 protein [Magnetovibrio sp.]|nr:glycosyltransferase family 39 protein [Magnetovibrio sp.]